MLVHICMFVHLYNFLLLRGWLGLPWQLLKVVILFVRLFLLVEEKANCLPPPRCLSASIFPLYYAIMCLYFAWRDLTVKYTEIHLCMCIWMSVLGIFFQSHLISFILSFEHTCIPKDTGRKMKYERAHYLFCCSEWGMERNNLSVGRNDKDDDKHSHTHTHTYRHKLFHFHVMFTYT